jgi:hypothetical protein
MLADFILAITLAPVELAGAVTAIVVEGVGIELVSRGIGAVVGRLVMSDPEAAPEETVGII